MNDGPAHRIMIAWSELETAMREALPVCSISPPNQPGVLLAALRINHRIGQEEEERIMGLRETRNRVAYDPGEPPEDEADRFEAEVALLKGQLDRSPPGIC